MRHCTAGQVAADRDGVIVRVTDGGDDLSDAFSATTNTVAAIGPTGEAWLAVNRNSGEVRVDNLTITGGHLDTDHPDTPLNVHGTLGALDGRTAVRAGDTFVWLVLNPDSKFTTGVRTPLDFEAADASARAGPASARRHWGSSVVSNGVGVRGAPGWVVTASASRGSPPRATPGASAARS